MGKEILHLLLLLPKGAKEREILELLRKRYRVFCTKAFTLEDFKKSIEKKNYQVILCHNLAEVSPLEALKVLTELGKEIPFFVLAERESVEEAVECVKNGACDYICWENLPRLVAAVEKELKNFKVKRRESVDNIKELWAQSEAIVQNAVDAIVTIDEKGRIQLFNPAAEKLFGYKKEEVLGKDVSILMPEEDAKRHPEYLRRYLKTGKKRIIGIGREVQGKKKDGTLFPLYLSVSEINLPGKRLFTAIMSDITQQKKMEEALRRSEEKFRKLYDEAPIMYFTQDEHCRVVDVNQTALDKLGYQREEVVGVPLSDFFIEESLGSFQEHIQKLKAHSFTSGEGQMKTKSGEVIDVIFTLRLEDESGIVKTTCVDISETKKLQQQLMHADRLASLGQLAAGISHEINQPLSCISMSAEILLDQLEKGRLDLDFLKSELKDILHQTSRIVRIIQNIKTFTRDIPKKVVQKLDVNQVMDAALSLTKRQLVKAGIELKLELAKDLPPLLGDMHRLEQVFVNLLLNAQDALEEKEKKYSDWKGPKQIKISSYLEDSHIVVEVWDNGVGIPKSEIPKIFDPFYTTKEVGRGTGLGLSIAHGIVSDMQGKIECESEVGQWTRFRLIFPLLLSEERERVSLSQQRES